MGLPGATEPVFRRQCTGSRMVVMEGTEGTGATVSPTCNPSAVKSLLAATMQQIFAGDQKK